jgi:hypothetical protein
MTAGKTAQRQQEKQVQCLSRMAINLSGPVGIGLTPLSVENIYTRL